MSWEDVDNAFDHTRPEDITVHLDLDRLGELVGRVASELCRYRGLEPFDPHTDEARHIAVDAWRYVCHMADRAEFEKSVAKDLESLAAPSNTPTDVTQDRGTSALERRMEPPV